MHRLEITSLARKQLENLRGPLRARIESAIAALASHPHPHGAVKLVDRENTWRIRVGDYRVIYEVHSRLVLVVIVRVAHRREAYR